MSAVVDNPTGTFAVPIIDITPYTANGSAAQRAVVAAQVDDAASSVGFIQIVGHEIPAAVIEEFTAVMDNTAFVEEVACAEGGDKTIFA